jgi:putative FmdB family regulatory protein
MPTYEYKCPEGHRFELFQKMSEEPRANCPECGAESERLLSGGAGFLFKGNGFYITDYRSDSYKKDESKEKPGGTPEKTPAKKAEKGGDSPSTSGKAKDSGSTSSPSGGSSPEGS